MKIVKKLLPLVILGSLAGCAAPGPYPYVETAYDYDSAYFGPGYYTPVIWGGGGYYTGYNNYYRGGYGGYRGGWGEYHGGGGGYHRR